MSQQSLIRRRRHSPADAWGREALAPRWSLEQVSHIPRPALDNTEDTKWPGISEATAEAGSTRIPSPTHDFGQIRIYPTRSPVQHVAPDGADRSQEVPETSDVERHDQSAGSSHAAPVEQGMRHRAGFSIAPPVRPIAVSNPDDPEEREAERVARQILSAPVGSEPPGIAINGQSRVANVLRCPDCGACAKAVSNDEEELQVGGLTAIEHTIYRCPACKARRSSASRATERAGDHQPEAQGDRASSGHLPLAGSGAPLSAATRSFFEPRFGHDFSRVRIHQDSQADAAARQIGARAFAVDQNIYFARGQFNPASATGQRLLAHELTHTIQASTERRAVPVARRNPLNSTQPDNSDSGTTARAPVRAALQISLSGMRFTPPGEVNFEPGPKLPQGIAIILRRLIGDAYEPGLEVQLARYLQSAVAGFRAVGYEGSAGENEALIPLQTDSLVSAKILSWLSNLGYDIVLTDNQREILAYGLFVENAWQQLNHTIVQDQLGFSFPEWYAKGIFVTEMARRRSILRDYVTATVSYAENPSEEMERVIQQVLDQIITALLPAILVVDMIREDSDLHGHEGYVALFGGADPGADPDSEPAEQNPRALSIFITFIGTQPDLSRRVISDYEEAVGRELLDRFVRYLERALVSDGDQVMTDAPGGANAPPHPSSMSTYPPLEPPLFDAALGTDHTFVMSLQFPTVFDAFARYYFDWDRIRVPDEQIASEMNVDEMEGETPSMWEVAGARFSRAGRYMVTDVQRTITGIEGTLGTQPGIGASTLATANGILRFIGTGISLFFDIISTPQLEIKVVFPEEGLYLVRSKAIPILQGDEEVVRAPSVAYVPVFARSPQEMAEQRTQMAMSAEQQGIERMLELQELLSEPMTHLNQDALESEYEGLSASLGSMEDMLTYQHKQITERLDDLPAHSEERQSLESRLEELNLMIEHRQDRAKKRPLHRAERLPATFISDLGQTISLALEAVQISGPDNPWLGSIGIERYYISDVTTRQSGQETGQGGTKAEAIESALRSLLEGPSGYGRGYCSVAIDGRARTIRIDASEGMLVMEAIENLTMVASIAAVAAAPFTAGASLSLLLPIGAVGMTPSAYRLASRAEAGTLHLDLQTAMEIVNIVGGVAGLGHAATPMRFLRLSKGLMVVGLGTDGLGVMVMGAGVMEQIEALADLPAGLRAARTMEIIGGAMIEAGIAVGGSLAGRPRQLDVETTMASSDPRTNRLLAVEAQQPVRIGGEDHRVRVGVENGQMVVRLCSSCLILVRRIEQMLETPDVRDTPGLRDKLVRIQREARRLERDMNEGRSDPSDVGKAIDELTRQVNELASVHPDQAAQTASPETPGQHERRNILEDIAMSTGQETLHRFTLREGVRQGEPQNSFARIAREIGDRVEQIRATEGRDPLPAYNDATLGQRGLDVVFGREDLSSRYTELYKVVVLRDPVLLAQPEYRSLSPQTLNRMRRDLESFDGRVRDKRPDVVDIDLNTGIIEVSDLTFEPSNPWHNFKTLFYKAVLEEMTGLQVRALDITARRSSTPVIFPIEP